MVEINAPDLFHERGEIAVPECVGEHPRQVGLTMLLAVQQVLASGQFHAGNQLILHFLRQLNFFLLDVVEETGLANLEINQCDCNQCKCNETCNGEMVGQAEAGGHIEIFLFMVVGAISDIFLRKTMKFNELRTRGGMLVLLESRAHTTWAVFFRRIPSANAGSRRQQMKLCGISLSGVQSGIARQGGIENTAVVVWRGPHVLNKAAFRGGWLGRDSARGLVEPAAGAAVAARNWSAVHHAHTGVPDGVIELVGHPGGLVPGRGPCFLLRASLVRGAPRGASPSADA